MKAGNLATELYAAAANISSADLELLARIGIPWSAVADGGYPTCGLVPAEQIGGGLYQPGEGARHIVQPVFNAGDLVDLVAWRSNEPSRWWLRNGDGWCLGDLDEIVSAALWQPEVPVLVHATPLDWLLADCGLCVVNWSSSEIRELNRLQLLEVADRRLASLIHDTLTKPPRLPEIRVKRGDLRAAA